MNKKIIIPTILFIFVSIFSFYVLWHQRSENHLINSRDIKQENRDENAMILFYGSGCPHCQIVEDYIEKNQINKKIIFSQKEVYNNSANAQELRAKAEICGLPADSIGVPFFWTGKDCLIGDQDIINFFKQNIKQ